MLPMLQGLTQDDWAGLFPLGDVVYQLMGGLYQSMFYVGARTIPELKEHRQFVQITSD